MSTITLSGTAVFENIDRLSQVEMRTQGLPVGIIGQLYTIARADGEPLAQRAAAALLDPSIELSESGIPRRVPLWNDLKATKTASTRLPFHQLD